MYVRPPAESRGRVKIPENYSGHAFRDQSPFGDMPPPTHIDNPVRRERSNGQATDDRPPYHSPSPPPQDDREDPLDDAFPDYSTHESDLYHGNEDERPRVSDSETSKKDAENSQKTSIFSSLLPSSTSGARHFPFGHGIGSEEILILAIMLLVYLSGDGDEPDNELLLLLGFLLFAG